MLGFAGQKGWNSPMTCATRAKPGDDKWHGWTRQDSAAYIPTSFLYTLLPAKKTCSEFPDWCGAVLVITSQGITTQLNITVRLVTRILLT